MVQPLPCACKYYEEGGGKQDGIRKLLMYSIYVIIITIKK